MLFSNNLETREPRRKVEMHIIISQAGGLDGAEINPPLICRSDRRVFELSLDKERN